MIAFQRLVKSPKFKVWHTRKVYEVSNNEIIEQKVEKMMKNNNLKFETKNELDQWEENESI